MSWLRDLATILRALIVTGPAPVSAPRGIPQPMKRRVLVVTYHPVVTSEGGQKLDKVLGWNDPDELCGQYCADLHEVSGGLADFEVVDELEVDGWPAKVDGFCYEVDGYVACYRGGGGWHEPDAVDYHAIVADHKLLSRVAAGDIDEVWLFGTPSAGFYESIMVGPGAFWCNSPALPNTEAAGRRFIIMGFSYERGVGEMLESFSHRVESIMERTWRRYMGDVQRNLWERFTLYDQAAPGKANCGTVHYAPNSVRDYDWGNTRFVPSCCDDWLSFPELKGAMRQVNCTEWGNGDTRGHHKWWLRHLPRAAGETLGVSNNWWQYVIDPNLVS